MDFLSFKQAIAANEPPQNISPYLKALWFDAKGDWNKAHKLIQEIEDKNAAWIHAYLHRKEGDISNATYWYNRAGKNCISVSLEEEWKQLVNNFINSTDKVH